MPRVTIWLMFVSALAVAACAAPAASRPLTIFAAASLTEAFTEIGEEFKQTQPNVQLQFNFGGSATLRAQIEQGARADVFASANAKEVNTLVTSNFIEPAAPQVFLQNELIIIAPPQNPRQIKNYADLAQPKLKLILAAESVPVGQYAREALIKMETTMGAGFKSNVLRNVVSNEDNVRQVVAKVQLAEAEVGIVYKSDAVATPTLTVITLPPQFNVTAHYPIATLRQSANPKLAQEFVAFVLSAKGQAILKKWGFTPNLP